MPTTAARGTGGPARPARGILTGPRTRMQLGVGALEVVMLGTIDLGLVARELGRLAGEAGFEGHGNDRT